MLAFPPDAVVGVAYDLVSTLSGITTTAAAIVLFVAAARLLLHPLARSAARGERARASLAPKVRKLQERHRRDPERARRALAELYRKEGTSPLAGLFPALLQAPVFMLMYRLFSAGELGGQPNELLGRTLAGAPLGAHWLDAPLGAQGAVFAVLFALLAAVGTWSSRRAVRTAPVEGAAGTLLRLVPFGALLAAAFLPLATGVYLLTAAVWSAGERALLHRAPGRARPAVAGR